MSVEARDPFRVPQKPLQGIEISDLQNAPSYLQYPSASVVPTGLALFVFYQFMIVFLFKVMK